MEPTGLDHDDGIDGLSTERSTVLRRKGQHIGGIPIFAMAQMQKDKNQHMLNVRIHPPPLLPDQECRVMLWLDVILPPLQLSRQTLSQDQQCQTQRKPLLWQNSHHPVSCSLC